MLNRRWVLAVIAATVAIGAGAVELARTGSPAEAGKAVVAGVIAVATVGLAASLPGTTVRGWAIGGFFALAGILTWTATTRPILIWSVLGAGGVVCAVWARPGLRALSRLGTAWLGLAYWLLGIVGAALVGHVGVGLQRVAYAGVFTLAALAVLAAVKRPGGDDLSIGIVAAILVAIGALFLAGSGNLLDAIHTVPNDNPATLLMRDRFWGGTLLYYHPNSLCGLAIVAAIRIGPDRAFAVWQRLAATVLAGFVLYLTNSRIGLVFAGAVAMLHAVLIWRRSGTGLPAYRRPWLAAAVPFVVLALVLVLSGGQGFLFRNRFGSGDVTSGRTDTWKQVVTDWQHASWAEKVFGDARTSRAVVVRTNDGALPGTPHRKLNTDNAAVGALRRGGVLGAVAFLFGLCLLAWHALRRRAGGVPPAAWFTIAALGAIPTIATEDWLLGGTNGGLWILLLAGEAYCRYGSRT